MTRETAVNLLITLLLLGLPLVAAGIGEPFYVTLATRVVVLALAAVGHAAFFGLGGYAAGILATHAFNAEPLFAGVPATTSMPMIWLGAVMVAGLVALPIGVISLRTTGVYFIMITLAFAQMIYYFAISWPAYGGEDGLSIYVRNAFPGINTAQPLPYFLICFAVLMATLLLFRLVEGSRFVRLAAVGIQPFQIRLVAFTLSAMITGLAGALYADLNRFVGPSMLSWHMSGELIVLIILGGKGRLFGPVAGAMIFVCLEYVLGGITERWQFFLGLILLCIVLFARGGFLGLVSGKPRHV
jgi:branched-chain amino acid transport system permease protein